MEGGKTVIGLEKKGRESLIMHVHDSCNNNYKVRVSS